MASHFSWERSRAHWGQRIWLRSLLSGPDPWMLASWELLLAAPLPEPSSARGGPRVRAQQAGLGEHAARLSQDPLGLQGSHDVTMLPRGCQAPSVKAPPGRLGTDANQKLLALRAAATWSSAGSPVVHGGEGGQRRAPTWDLAFEIIGCSLKGSQRGTGGSLEVKESQPPSQPLATSATLPLPPAVPGLLQLC